MSSVINFKPSTKRLLLIAAVDAVIILLSLVHSAYLRYEFDPPRGAIQALLHNLPYILPAYMMVLVLFRSYSVMWRYASGRQYFLQAMGVLVAGAVVFVLNIAFSWGISRALLILSCFLSTSLTTASRLAARSYRAHRLHPNYSTKRKNTGDYPPLLIVGAGEAGNYVVAQSLRNPHAYGFPVALADDAPNKRGMSVQGIPVYGSADDIPDIVEKHAIRNIIIAMPSVKGERMKQIIALCNATKCQVRLFNDPEAAQDVGSSNILSLREPNLADFLSREEIHIDDQNVRAYIQGQTVMVTGGGGSIGSEICRQVMRFSPKQLVIFDIYENGAYELLMDFHQQYGQDCPVSVYVGSVRDRARLDEVMALCHPQAVFHAAAHKHVPLLETSTAEAVKNNVFGTINVMESAEKHGVERFVMLSTDKAVNPTNIMGATKRVAELAMQLFSIKARMKCMAVRFGNVLGSHGSVVPLFERQIRSGGPVTLTHPDVTRYFMTIPEAASLVLQAGGMGNQGRIYVLDVGELVYIRDLADKLIRFYGFEPGVDMEVQVVGLRPGEKLFEELLLDEEVNCMSRTGNDKIMVAPPLAKDEAVLRGQIERLRLAAAKGTESVEGVLQEILPNFHHAVPERALEELLSQPAAATA